MFCLIGYFRDYCKAQSERSRGALEWVLRSMILSSLSLFLTTELLSNWFWPVSLPAVAATPTPAAVAIPPAAPVSFELSKAEIAKKQISRASINGLKELIFENLGEALKCLNSIDRASAELSLVVADVQDFCTDRIEQAFKDSRVPTNFMRSRDQAWLQASASDLVDIVSQAVELEQQLKQKTQDLQARFSELKKRVNSAKMKS